MTLLIPAFALLVAPALLPLRLPRSQNAPLPCSIRSIHSFGEALEPRWIVGARARSTSELLRTL